MITRLTTPRWLITHSIVLLALTVLISFGRWQLDRLEQRRTLNANVMQALDQPPTILDGSMIEPTDFHLRRVRVTGTFDNEANIIIRNQQFENQSGVDVVTPLRIAGSDRAVLVNRGWIPRGNVDPPPESRRVYDVEGEVTIEGIAYRTETRPNRFAPLDPTPAAGKTRLDAWFRVDIERLQQQLPYPLLPIFVEQTAPTDPDNLPRQTAGIDLSEGPHLSYALQWFSFAVILAVTYVLLLWQEVKKG